MQVSYHSFEQIQNRGITTQQIEQALQQGARWRCNHRENIHYARHGRLFVVMHGTSDWVVTAYNLQR